MLYDAYIYPAAQTLANLSDRIYKTFLEAYCRCALLQPTLYSPPLVRVLANSLHRRAVVIISIRSERMSSARRSQEPRGASSSTLRRQPKKQVLHTRMLAGVPDASIVTPLRCTLLQNAVYFEPSVRVTRSPPKPHTSIQPHLPSRYGAAATRLCDSIH